MLVAGDRLRIDRAADRDGGAVPDAGGPARALGERGRGYGLDVIWILPLLGLIALRPGTARASGRCRQRWRWPLITWAAIVAIAWPIVFCAKPTSRSGSCRSQRVSNTSIGIGPWEVDQNVAYFAIGHLLGILWIDALCRWYRRRSPRASGAKCWRPAGGRGASPPRSSIYQGFFDLGFLNEGFWEYMIRASGTLGDPNKLGAVAGFWTIGAIVFARRMPRPWSAVIADRGRRAGRRPRCGCRARAPAWRR